MNAAASIPYGVSRSAFRKSIGPAFAAALLVCAILGLVVGLLGACNGGAKSPTLTPRQVARAAVASLDSAASAAAESCIAVGKAEGNTALLTQCKMTFLQVVGPLEVAGAGVDAWTDANAGNVACAIQDVVTALQFAAGSLTQASITVPQAVEDAIGFAGPILPQCVRSDAAPEAAPPAPVDEAGAPPVTVTANPSHLALAFALNAGDVQ